MTTAQHLVSITAAPALTEQVYLRLLNAICDGELAPGARLTQEECAASLGVSRQPVIQALHLLKSDGLVVDAGKRGVRVTRLDPRFVAQVYEVRTALDALAARLAVQRGAKLDPGLIQRGRAAMRADRTTAMIEADEAFHRAVYDASGNPLLVESARRHWPHIRRAMGAVLRRPDTRDPVWDEHEAILRAVNEGRAEDAERLSLKHGAFGGQAMVAGIAAPSQAHSA